MIPLELLACWYFVTQLDWGIEGAAMAINLTSAVTLLCQLQFLAFCHYVRGDNLDLRWPSRGLFAELSGQLLLRDTIPSILSVQIENLYQEFLILFAAMLHRNEMLAAQIILTSLGQFLTMIPYSLSISAYQMVCHSLNRVGRVDHAILFCWIIAVSTTGLCLICTLLVNLNKGDIIGLFTENQEVSLIAQHAFMTFSVAFSLEWILQCV